MVSPRIRASSCGAWKPIEFSAATKSSRHCALRCSAAAALSVGLGGARPSRGDDRVEHVGGRLRRALQERVVAVLDREHPRLAAPSRRPRDTVWQARLTLSSGLRTQWSLTFSAPTRSYGHVAVRARHARARVDALVPHLELRVLRLEHLGARSPRASSP